jgi:hypothetical protein
MSDHDKHEYAMLQKEIGKTFIQILPSQWHSATLMLKAPEAGLEVGEITPNIIAPGTQKEAIFPSMALINMIKDFQIKSVKHKLKWKKARISVFRNGNDWEIDTQLYFEDSGK